MEVLFNVPSALRLTNLTLAIRLTVRTASSGRTDEKKTPFTKPILDLCIRHTTISSHGNIHLILRKSS